MTTKYPYALSPINIGSVTIPNRLVRTAHATLFSRKHLSEAHILYHLERARGGIGLTILEGASVHRSSTYSLDISDDSAIGPLSALAEAIEPTGMKLFQQLWHGGGIEPAPNGGPPWSVTTLPGRYSKMPPIAMTERQITELVRAYGEAAVRLAKANVHGAEILAGNGYLISHFLSPSLNTRTDAYGGTFQNRIRFLAEVLSEIRSHVPTNFVLGVRLGASSNPGILSTKEINSVALWLQSQGLMDYLNISQGDYYYHVERYAAMDQPVGYQLPYVKEIGQGITVPKIIVGRFGTLDDAEQTLRVGDADMVNLVRATIADPYLVKKEIEGRSLEVRPCIGCNQGCIGGLFSGRMSCTVNPTVGYESILAESLITNSAEPKAVLVIGGGPAGMEAARISAISGHDVTLVEASADLGGLINLAKLLPKNHGIGDLTNWLEREIFRLGVKVKLSTYMDSDDVFDMHPDVVIIATGSCPPASESLLQTAAPDVHVPFEPGAHVITPSDLIRGTHSDLGATAVVFDDVGHLEAVGCCELLIQKGLDVTYVTRHSSFAPEFDKTGRAQAALRRIYALGNFRIATNAVVLSINKSSVEIRPLDGVRSETVPADTAVLVTHRDPMNEMWKDLVDLVPEIYIVGDALSPRDLVSAMREGHLSARSIDNKALNAMWNNM
jgi:2,4-dienoyl-CoA reductase-like NADH-dependent reductase (Old Yellow Enzyme family)/thioredoxin reductase